MKTSGDLRRKAIVWANRALWMTAFGIAAVSVATPLVSSRIFDKWFAWPEILWVSPIPLASLVVFAITARLLALLGRGEWRASWKPFVGSVALFVLAFLGRAYSLYPYLLVDRMTAAQAASATESLWMIFLGTAVTLPAILAYTVFSYRVFCGKADELRTTSRSRPAMLDHPPASADVEACKAHCAARTDRAKSPAIRKKLIPEAIFHGTFPAPRFRATQAGLPN